MTIASRAVPGRDQSSRSMKTTRLARFSCRGNGTPAAPAGEWLAERMLRAEAKRRGGANIFDVRTPSSLARSAVIRDASHSTAAAFASQLPE
jgi:hypothetical protein